MLVKIVFMLNGLCFNLFFFMIFFECLLEQVNNVVVQSFLLYVIYGFFLLGVKLDMYVQIVKFLLLYLLGILIVFVMFGGEGYEMVM